MKKVSREEYMRAVDGKLRATTNLLRFGPIDPKIGKPLRDDLGIAVTFANIRQIAGNLFDHAMIRSNGREKFAQELANFSNAGYADVSSVQTIGAIDVTIMTLANSLVPFLAVDRAMSNPIDTIYFSDMVAVNSAAGVSAGDTVIGNFTPPNTAVRLGPATLSLTTVAGGTGPVTLSFGYPLVPGNTVVTLIISSVTYVGQDFKSDGNVYFTGTSVTATVDYVGGTITTSSVVSGNSVNGVVLLDVSKDETGTNVLKVKPLYTATQLVTSPKNLIYEQNAANSMYMNRILATAKAVGGLDYASLHFNRVNNIYIDDVNRDILRALIAASASDSSVTTLDLSTYTVSSQAGSKNDLVARFFIAMRTAFLAKTGVAPTVIVTSTRGSAELESHPTKFVANPDFYQVLNGLVGYFDGMPVFRHNYMDFAETSTHATFYMAAKLPDNSSGTLAFGEFLPLTQTATVGNFDNPIESATGFFSQVGTATIQNTLVKKGQITYAS